MYNVHYVNYLIQPYNKDNFNIEFNITPRPKFPGTIYTFT